MCSKKQIDLLFQKGKTAVNFPLKLVYLETDVEYVKPCQAMFVVPKRTFKRAHDRNKLKRRMKEAYRLDKHNFYSELIANNKRVICAFIFIGNKQVDYDKIKSSLLALIFDKLKQKT